MSICDEPVLCAGLAELMRGIGDLACIGQARDAREAFPLLERTRPDVALIDVLLPGMDGIGAARELRWRVPATRVLMFGRLREGDVARALGAGACGFALRTETFAGLVDAIRCVAKGECYLAPQLRDHPLFEPRARLKFARRPSDERAAFAVLSPRELEVLRFLVRGWRADRVASELCLSSKTVCTHRARIYRKLGCHSICELTRMAALNGILDELT